MGSSTLKFDYFCGEPSASILLPSLGSTFFDSSNFGYSPFCESLNVIISGSFRSLAGTVDKRVSPGYFFRRTIDTSIAQGSFGIF